MFFRHAQDLQVFAVALAEGVFIVDDDVGLDGVGTALFLLVDKLELKGIGFLAQLQEHLILNAIEWNVQQSLVSVTRLPGLHLLPGSIDDFQLGWYKLTSCAIKKGAVPLIHVIEGLAAVYQFDLEAIGVLTLHICAFVAAHCSEEQTKAQHNQQDRVSLYGTHSWYAHLLINKMGQSLCQPLQQIIHQYTTAMVNLSGIFNRKSKESPSGPVPQDQYALAKRIQKKQYLRIRQDINRWRSALTQAENPEQPNRTALYQLYDDLVLDNHLNAAMATRRQHVLSAEFELEGPSGNKEEGKDWLQREWFYRFMRHALDSLFYGHSLVEFAPKRGEEFSDLRLIPRSNVIPETGMIKTKHTERKGSFSYRDSKYQNYLIELGSPEDLGLLAKAAPNVLWKKVAQSAWSEYAELFGMPLRVGKTNTSDAQRFEQLEEMLKNMGSAAYAVFDETEEVEFVESKQQDAWQVFDRLVERCNTEISKLILGQTMTADAGSSYSQAQVHEHVMGAYTASDKRFLAFVINAQLMPFLLRHGYPLDGLRFQWVEQEANPQAPQQEEH